MYKPVIYMGSDYIYNENKCDSIEKKIKLKKALKEIENEIKKKGVEVIKPVRRDKNKICRSLWVRDSSFTIHNQVYLMPQMVKSDDRDRSKQIASEVDVIPYVMDGEIVPESVNLDGGDIIIDGKTIFVGKGERTDDSGVEYLRKKFPEREVIVIVHHALHLDCCFGVLPGKILLYSSKYVKRLPSVLRDRYTVYKVENYMRKGADANLATNYLLIGKTIIIAYKKKFEKIYKLMEELGFEVKTIPFSNIFLDGGGVRCMTQWYKMPKDQEIF